jgi:hypothetical protein
MAIAPEATVDSFAASDSLHAVLDGIDIVLLTLAVNAASPSLTLVDLGRVRADVAVRLAPAVRKGAPAA